MTLADVPYYLQRRRGAARVAVTPCWLHEADAIAAAADLEYLEVVGDRWASMAPFGRISFASQGAREVMAERYWDGEVERLVAEYHALVSRQSSSCRTRATGSGS